MFKGQVNKNSMKEASIEEVLDTLNLALRRIRSVHYKVYRCNKSGTINKLCNRDSNASINMFHLFKHWLQNKPRPRHLRRSNKPIDASKSKELQL